MKESVGRFGFGEETLDEILEAQKDFYEKLNQKGFLPPEDNLRKYAYITDIETDLKDCEQVRHIPILVSVGKYYYENNYLASIVALYKKLIEQDDENTTWVFHVMVGDTLQEIKRPNDGYDGRKEGMAWRKQAEPYFNILFDLFRDRVSVNFIHWDELEQYETNEDVDEGRDSLIKQLCQRDIQYPKDEQVGEKNIRYVVTETAALYWKLPIMLQRRHNLPQHQVLRLAYPGPLGDLVVKVKSTLLQRRNPFLTQPLLEIKFDHIIIGNAPNTDVVCASNTDICQTIMLNPPVQPREKLFRRKKYLQDSCDALEKNHVALLGFKGYGKSSIAKCMFEMLHMHPNVHYRFWLDATNTNRMLDYLYNRYNHIFHFTGADKVKEELLRWLSTNNHWFVVLDDPDPNNEYVKQLLAIKTGRIVITTNFDVWPNTIATIKIEKPEQKEALEFFQFLCDSPMLYKKDKKKKTKNIDDSIYDFLWKVHFIPAFIALGARLLNSDHKLSVKDLVSDESDLEMTDAKHKLDTETNYLTQTLIKTHILGGKKRIFLKRISFMLAICSEKMNIPKKLLLLCTVNGRQELQPNVLDREIDKLQAFGLIDRYDDHTVRFHGLFSGAIRAVYKTIMQNDNVPQINKKQIDIISFVLKYLSENVTEIHELPSFTKILAGFDYRNILQEDESQRLLSKHLALRCTHHSYYEYEDLLKLNQLITNKAILAEEMANQFAKKLPSISNGQPRLFDDICANLDYSEHLDKLDYFIGSSCYVTLLANTNIDSIIEQFVSNPSPNLAFALVYLSTLHWHQIQIGSYYPSELHITGANNKPFEDLNFSDPEKMKSCITHIRLACHRFVHDWPKVTCYEDDTRSFGRSEALHSNSLENSKSIAKNVKEEHLKQLRFAVSTSRLWERSDYAIKRCFTASAIYKAQRGDIPSILFLITEDALVPEVAPLIIRHLCHKPISNGNVLKYSDFGLTRWPTERRLILAIVQNPRLKELAISTLINDCLRPSLLCIPAIHALIDSVDFRDERHSELLQQLLQAAENIRNIEEMLLVLWRLDASGNRFFDALNELLSSTEEVTLNYNKIIDALFTDRHFNQNKVDNDCMRQKLIKLLTIMLNDEDYRIKALIWIIRLQLDDDIDISQCISTLTPAQISHFWGAGSNELLEYLSKPNNQGARKDVIRFNQKELTSKDKMVIVLLQLYFNPEKINHEMKMFFKTAINNNYQIIKGEEALLPFETTYPLKITFRHSFPVDHNLMIDGTKHTLPLFFKLYDFFKATFNCRLSITAPLTLNRSIAVLLQDVTYDLLNQCTKRFLDYVAEKQLTTEGFFIEWIIESLSYDRFEPEKKTVYDFISEHHLSDEFLDYVKYISDQSAREEVRNNLLKIKDESTVLNRVRGLLPNWLQAPN